MELISTQTSWRPSSGCAKVYLIIEYLFCGSYSIGEKHILVGIFIIVRDFS